MIMSDEKFPVSYVISKATKEYFFEVKVLAKNEKTLDEVLSLLDGGLR